MIKRGMKATVCCMALVCMFVFSLLPVQAAWCSHKYRYIILNDFEGYHYEADGHFAAYGTAYVCADCGDTYWEDLEYRWIEDHCWSNTECMESNSEFDIYRRVCIKPECGVEELTYYYK